MSALSWEAMAGHTFPALVSGRAQPRAQVLAPPPTGSETASRLFNPAYLQGPRWGNEIIGKVSDRVKQLTHNGHPLLFF